MKISFPKYSSILVLVVLVFLAGNWGCAVQIPPMGGPRDSLPPVLVTVRPSDSTANFSSRKITFEFNEFVQLDNARQNMMVTPIPKVEPTVEGKLRTVTVTLKDTLQPNTTYYIDFGKSIKDVNEGNVMKNFGYVFTTGTHIDSLTLAGKIIDAKTGMPDSTVMAALYRDFDDSAVAKKKPVYMARVNGQGQFRFRFLAPGKYALYAFADESGLKRYTSPAQKFAFYDDPVEVGGPTDSIVLYSYVEESNPQGAGSKGSVAPVKAGNRKNNSDQDKILRLNSNLEGNQLDLLKNLQFYFHASPLAEFDSSKIRLTDEQFAPVSNYRMELDSTRDTLTIYYKWAPGTTYQLLIDKDFAQDSTGRKLLKDDTLTIQTKKLSEYGKLRLRFQPLDLSKHPVLQFVQSGEVKTAFPLLSNTFTSDLFRPGDYELRILYDQNENGVWDPGSFFGGRKQPERVTPISRKLTIKANWENEVDINL